VVTRSPMMRLLVSPLVVQPRSPSLSPRRSPSRSPWRSPARSPRTSPACSLRSGAAHLGSHDHGNYGPQLFVWMVSIWDCNELETLIFIAQSRFEFMLHSHFFERHSMLWH
jgi:hypothetical protein